MTCIFKLYPHHAHTQTHVNPFTCKDGLSLLFGARNFGNHFILTARLPEWKNSPNSPSGYPHTYTHITCSHTYTYTHAYMHMHIRGFSELVERMLKPHGLSYCSVCVLTRTLSSITPKTVTTKPSN